MVVGVAGTAVAGFFLLQSWKMLNEFKGDSIASQHASTDGHGAASAGHGEPNGHGQGAAQGGDNGAAAAHGQSAATGASASAGHGSPASNGHGAESARNSASADPNKSITRTWVTMEQMFVNLAGPENDGHSLTFQMELELFEENHRGVLESRLATVKNAAIEVARDQSFDRLKSLSGKLYFKEALVTAMNETLHAPIIRDVHLSSIFLK
jgi:flagellar basal body-associated protein FliL